MDKWILDHEHSEIVFKVKHLMMVYTTGKIEDFEIQFQNQDDTSTNFIFQMTAKMNSLNTLHKIRDERIKAADFLDIETYPEMSFQSTALKRKECTDQLELQGNLSFKGKTNEVVLDGRFGGKARDSFSGEEKMGFTFNGKIDRRKWGVDFNLPFEGKGVTIGNMVKIRAELEFKKLKL